jgi:hypothetical protein
MSFSDELIAAGLRTPPFSAEYRFGYWEAVARLATRRFLSKADFMAWVYEHFAVEENRFAADACWDIMILRDSTNGKGPDG